MANLYFSEDAPSAAFAAGELLEVAGEEARHAVRVSRLRAGEEILVGDGAGTVGAGTVERTERERFAVRLREVRREPEPEPRVVLVQALAKGDRDERAVEQATEFGVDAVVPWQAARSVSRWDAGDKAARGVAKWRRIAREAAKQSVRARIPEVREPADLGALCRASGSPDAEVVVLHPRGAGTLSDWARGGREAAVREVLLVVGPEGGLADDELARLESAGARVARLGATVLRTSSAGPAALAVLNVALGRW